jgi:hypothetical protein
MSMIDPKSVVPWEDELASELLSSSIPWKAFIRMIRRTLELDPRDYPHQIRCAAGLMILLCRRGLWRQNDQERDELIATARRQLSNIKQLYSSEARLRPEIANSTAFRSLLKTLDEEMRVLDARLSDTPLNIPNHEPQGWGPFFSQKY